ncbi:hypothetical protein ABPG77_004367 [Micractinium sp. CCAP 211/92]
MASDGEALDGEGGERKETNDGKLGPSTKADKAQQLFGSAELGRSGLCAVHSGHIAHCTVRDAAAALDNLDASGSLESSQRATPPAPAPPADSREPIEQSAATSGQHVGLSDSMPAADTPRLQDCGTACCPALPANAGRDECAASRADPTTGSACTPASPGATWQGGSKLGQCTAGEGDPQDGLHGPAAEQQQQHTQPTQQGELSRQLQQQQQQPAPPAQQQQQQQQQCRGPPRRKGQSRPAVVVRGLSPATTAQALADVFRLAGRIKRLRLVTDESGASAGVAFINFYDQEAMLAAEALGQGLEIDGCRPTVRNVHNEAAAVPLRQSQPSGPPAAPTPSPRPQPALQGAAAAPAHGASQQPPSTAQQQAQQQRPQQRQQHEAADAMPWLLAGSLATAQQQDQFRGSRSSSASSLQSTTAGQLQRLPSLPGMAGVTGQPPAAGYPAATWGSASPSEPATSTDALYARPLALEVDEAMLREHFGPDAGVVSAKVMRYPDGTSRGCGIVRFCNADRAQHALQMLDGTQLAGRTVRLSWARHRQRSVHSTPCWERAGSPGVPYMDYGRSMPTPGDLTGMLPVMAPSPGYPAAVMVPAFYYPAYAPPMPGAPLATGPPMAAPQFSQLAAFGMVPAQQVVATPEYPQPPPPAPAAPAAAATSASERLHEGTDEQEQEQQQQQQQQQQNDAWPISPIFFWDPGSATATRSGATVQYSSQGAAEPASSAVVTALLSTLGEQGRLLS